MASEGWASKPATCAWYSASRFAFAIRCVRTASASSVSLCSPMYRPSVPLTGGLRRTDPPPPKGVLSLSTSRVAADGAVVVVVVGFDPRVASRCSLSGRISPVCADRRLVRAEHRVVEGEGTRRHKDMEPEDAHMTCRGRSAGVKT